MLSSLVLVIFFLLATLAGAGLLVFYVVKMFLDKLDMAIKLLADMPTEPGVTLEPTRKLKVFKRAPAAAPTLVGTKLTEEDDATNLVTHSATPEVSTHIPLEEADPELLGAAIDHWRGRGHMPPEETDKAN